MAQSVLPRPLVKYLHRLPPAQQEQLTPLLHHIHQTLAREGVQPEEVVAILASQSLTSPGDVSALLEALARLPHPLMPAVLQAHFGDREDKSQQKALKKALHHLKTQGVEVPEDYFKDQGPSLLAPVVEAASLMAYISRIDETGTRLVVMHLSGPAQPFTLLGIAANDIDGLQDGFALTLGRKEAKQRLEELKAEIPGTLAAVEPAYALGVLESCFEIAPQGPGFGVKLYRQYRGLLLDRLGTAPWIDLQDRLPEVEITNDLLTETVTLLGQEDFYGWPLAAAEIQPLVEKILAAENSPLYLTDDQKSSRLQALMSQAYQEFFPPPRRQLLSRRLLHMAYYFQQIDQPYFSRLAQAAALDVARERSPLEEESHFLAALVILPLRLLLDAAETAGQAGPGTGRIITDLSY